ncbi:MAG: hypothetical protein ACRDKT_13350 [Actinomycetota bacterium]
MELLAIGAVFFLGVVPVLVYLALKESGWDETVPAIRWMLNRKLKAFARAVASGDFDRAERVMGEIVRQARPASYSVTRQVGA